jgi:hypothetical protein
MRYRLAWLVLDLTMMRPSNRRPRPRISRREQDRRRAQRRAIPRLIFDLTWVLLSAIATTMVVFGPRFMMSVQPVPFTWGRKRNTGPKWLRGAFPTY